MATLASSLWWSGVAIVAAVGQTILTTAGMLSGLITSIVSMGTVDGAGGQDG